MIEKRHSWAFGTPSEGFGVALQVMRALCFAYRFWEPFGPLKVPDASRKPQKVLIGKAFTTTNAKASDPQQRSSTR
jgi:hypothetical protein